MRMPGLADAINREADWLRTHGDELPALLKEHGGPFEVVQGRSMRSPNTRKQALYLTHATYSDSRWGNARKLGTYSFRLAVHWPVGSTVTSIDIAEREQQALDEALELVVARIRGLMGDHTHGGRFLAVAEAPVDSTINVQYEPPEKTLPEGVLRAEVLYQAQDQAFI
ncbi:hypothetical protein [Saccharothrix hoggarensis]|uniref:Uncharacterized protein n=1 Tax=Saccharothrix hoggarensis TaxID=913853 RepID=A0ABW3QFW9_9PSEU